MDGDWEEHSVSYAHNLGASSSSSIVPFDKLVNSTTFGPRETNSYTSLVRLADNRALITYDQHRKLEAGDDVQKSYSMVFSL